MTHGKHLKQDGSPRSPGWYYDPEGRYSHQAYWDGETWTGAIRLRSNQVTGAWFVFGLIGGVVAATAVIRFLPEDGKFAFPIYEAVAFGLGLMGLGWASVIGHLGSRAVRYLLASLVGLAVGAFALAGSTGDSVVGAILTGAAVAPGFAVAVVAFLLGRLVGVIHRTISK